MSDQAKRICADCKNFEGNPKYPRCKAIKFENLVNGACTNADCHPERAAGTKCGPEGKMFARAAS